MSGIQELQHEIAKQRADAERRFTVTLRLSKSSAQDLRRTAQALGMSPDRAVAELLAQFVQSIDNPEEGS